MKIEKSNCNFPGIYVIKNSINGKIYVGKSKNCYNRLHQHLTDIRIESRQYNENIHLLNAFKKYGEDNFEYYIVEKFDEKDPKILEKLLSDRELYWMIELNSLDREKGYNLRYDSQGKCFCSEETSIKISNRLKKEWEEGIRDGHSDKLKEYWKNNNERKEQQSKIMSKNKTKYSYIIYDPNGNLITENGDYTMLKKLNLTSVLSSFSRKKSDDVFCKEYRIIRNTIKDIVQSS
jgi:group I intron endonuclease